MSAGPDAAKNLRGEGFPNQFSGFISNKETFTERQQHCNVTLAPHKEVCLNNVLTLTKHFLTSEKIRNLSAGLSPAQKSAGADVIGVAIAASLSRMS